MSTHPNVLLIVSDQHRYDSLGHTSDYPLKTPNLDRLASEGMRFSSAYTPIPLCTPARQAFLTGRRPEANGTLWNYDLGPRIPALSTDDYSWTRALHDRGYKTSYLGKWHVNPDKSPVDFGYDGYVSLEDYEAFRAERYPDVEYVNGWFGEIDPLPVDDTQTHWLAARAIDSLGELTASGAPWHLRLDFLEPHLPCRPAQEFADLYPPESIPPWGGFDDDLVGKPYIQRQQLVNWRVEGYEWSDWAPIVARYYAAITQMDDAIGRVLAALEATGQADDTIVVYTTDHGDMCGSHRMMDKHYVLYDDVVRVPLIVRWPGHTRAGDSRDEFVYNALDLPPTLTEITGAQGSELFQGRSLARMLHGEAIEDERQEVVATYNGQQFGLFTQRMVRNRRWKYIWNATDVDELYNLEADPYERHNRIADPEVGEVIAELRATLYRILIEDGDSLVDNPWMADQFLNNRKLSG